MIKLPTNAQKMCDDIGLDINDEDREEVKIFMHELGRLRRTYPIAVPIGEDIDEELISALINEEVKPAIESVSDNRDVYSAIKLIALTTYLELTIKLLTIRHDMEVLQSVLFKLLE